MARRKTPAPAPANAMPLEHWPLDRFKPYDRNPRRWGDGVVARMARAVKDFGFRVPVLAKSDGSMIDGHLRLAAAVSLNLATVPVLIADDMTPAQIKAFRISVNQAATWADWDFDLLAAEIGELKELDFDLGSLGFDDDEMANILNRGNDGMTDPDDVPEAPAEPVTMLGDVWVLGGHRLACGDSTNADTVQKLLGGVRPHLMVTDPPYGVEYDANWRNERARTCEGMGNRAVGKVLNDDQANWREAWALFSGDVAYVWHADLRARQVVESLEAAGFEMRAQIIWAKQQFAVGRGDYHFKHEPCWYAVRKGKRGHWAADRKQTTLWDIDKPQKSETGHSTQKPIECMKRPIENNSKPGDAVYEPFSGSGTTIIAGEMTGRRVFAIELSPAYVDVAIIRWQGFVGQKATLESTGQTFAQVKLQRLGVDSAPSAPDETAAPKPRKRKAKA